MRSGAGLRVMVATRRTQGARASDYSRTIDGELVFLPQLECDWGDPASFREGARYFIGLESREETTTAEIIDLDITADDVSAFVQEQLAAYGWTDHDALDAQATRMADQMLSLAALLATGVVVEKRGTQIRVRLGPDGADA